MSKLPKPFVRCNQGFFGAPLDASERWPPGGNHHLQNRYHRARWTDVFQVTGAFAEFERGMIHSRVMAGLDAAAPTNAGSPKFAAIWSLS